MFVFQVGLGKGTTRIYLVYTRVHTVYVSFVQDTLDKQNAEPTPSR